MHVIFEHTGDGRSSPEECRDLQVENIDWLEEWPHSDTMSHVDGVERIWSDKLHQIRVDFGDDGDDPAVPNVNVITVE